MTSSKTAVRTIPHSLEAEQAVIGRLLLDNALWDQIAGHLVTEDFYSPEHQVIFKTITRMMEENRPFDVLTLTEALKVSEQLTDKLTEHYIFTLYNNTPSVDNIVAYTNIVRERSVARRLIRAGQYIADLAYQPEERLSHELIDEAERCVFSLSEWGKREQGPVSAHTLVTEATLRMEALQRGEGDEARLTTSFKDFDQLTCGLQKGELIVLAARPSMGKTALGMNIAEHVAFKLKKPVLVFSLEMTGDDLVSRMISSLGRIDQHRLRSGKLTSLDWGRVTSVVNVLSTSRFFIDDTASLTPMEMHARARRLVREQGNLGLIVVDYLQLMHSPGHKGNRVLEISEISRSLKILAKELSVPVIAVSQLNRGLEQRNDKRPLMSDLRESGAIEQDADLIVFVYRDEVYHEDSKDIGTAEIIIAKHRNGPIGKVRLSFLGKYLRFEDHSYEKQMICSISETQERSLEVV